MAAECHQTGIVRMQMQQGHCIVSSHQAEPVQQMYTLSSIFFLNYFKKIVKVHIQTELYSPKAGRVSTLLLFRRPLVLQTPQSPADPENRSSGSCSRPEVCGHMNPQLLALVMQKGWLHFLSCPFPAPAEFAKSRSSLSHCRRRTSRHDQQTLHAAKHGKWAH